MNVYLKEFVKKNFKTPGKALDLGAGDFFDVACMKHLGWDCTGVDLTTGVNLEKKFLSECAPFDLVYSNFVIHKLVNKQFLIESAYENLKPGGIFYLQTFCETDKQSKSPMSKKQLMSLLRLQFNKIKIGRHKIFDNDFGHKHWHHVYELIAEK